MIQNASIQTPCPLFSPEHELAEYPSSFYLHITRAFAEEQCFCNPFQANVTPASKSSASFLL